MMFLSRFAASGAGIIVIAAVCLSFQNNLAPVVFAGGTNPATLLLLRFIALVVVMAAWCRATGRSLRIDRENLLPGYGTGLLFAGASVLVLTSFARIPVSLAILIVYMHPILTFLGESLLDRRPPGVAALACMAGAFAGLALALQVRLDGLDALGIACAAAGALGISLAFLCNARLVQPGHSAALTLHMSIMGIVFAAAFTFLPGQFVLAQDSGLDWAVLVLAIAVFGTGFFSMFLGVRRIGASAAGQLMNLEPVLTVLLAVAIFGEAMSPRQAAGAALVVACVAASQWLRLRAAAAQLPR